jgi:nucleotide-binding universal stress UspA family protein
MDPFGLGFDPESAQQVAKAAAPYLVAAARSLGERLWSQTEDVVADEAAGWGRRLARRLRHQDPTVQQVIDESAGSPSARLALPYSVEKVLEQQPQVLAEFAAILARAQGAAGGSRNVTGRVSHSVVVTGDHNTVLGRP